jgi:hypothetical protein
MAAMGTPQQVAVRCGIVLSAAGGMSEAANAAAHGVNRKTVRLWRERFTRLGPSGLWEIAPAAAESDLRCNAHQAVSRRDAANQARGQHALELPNDGGSAGS